MVMAPSGPTPDYARSLPPAWQAVRETHAPYRREARWTERHLQCVWSDDALRPTPLRTDVGEAVIVEQPGRWNLEAGPDFLDAVLRVGTEGRRVEGDVEIHIRPSDWTQHRHAADPRYARVVAHVTYYPGTPPPEGLPPHVLRLALRDGLLARPAFSFDDIDLAAYPHAVIPPTPRPCAAALGDDPGRTRALLLSAGRYRLELKAQRLAARIDRTQDVRQVFYEETLAALGFKHNAGAFRRLAQALPLHTWPELPMQDHYARLLGVAGLLPPVDAGADDETRHLLRTLWDAWWRNPAPVPDPPLAWVLGAQRPANHPARRLAAAAALFGGGGDLLDALRSLPTHPPARWFSAVCRRLRERAVLACWTHRLTLTGRTGAAGGALLGASRGAAIATNVLVPLLCATGDLPDALLDALPAEDISAPMRATAAHLLGRDHNPALYAASGLMQQGLLQVYADFCLNARDGCANCRLAASLA